MKVIWTERAIWHLKHIREYIADEDPLAAARVATALYETTSKLARFPAIGRPGRIPNTRELVMQGLPFVIPYTVDENRVLILAVLHMSRKWPDDFKSQ